MMPLSHFCVNQPKDRNDWSILPTAYRGLLSISWDRRGRLAKDGSGRISLSYATYTCSRFPDHRTLCLMERATADGVSISSYDPPAAVSAQA